MMHTDIGATAMDEFVSKIGHSYVDTQTKRVWLQEWLKSQPRIPTNKEAREALLERFHEALGTTYIANAIREAHERFAEEIKKRNEESTTVPIVVPEAPKALPLRRTVQEIAVMMREAGIKKIILSEDGQIDFEAFTSIMP